MHLLLHQVSWPAILDLKSVGTGPSSRPILLPFRGNFFCFSCVFFMWVCKAICFMIILFLMALYSFGGENGQCGVTSWAVQETGMLPLLSCCRRIQVCPGKKRKNWRCQSYRWFRRSVRDHIRAQMIFIAVYGTLLLEERQWYIIYDVVVSNCLFTWLIDSHVNFLGPYEEH